MTDNPPEGLPTPAIETVPDAPAAAGSGALFGLATVLGLCVAVLATYLFGWLADEMLEGDTATFDHWIRGASQTLASPGLTRSLVLVSRLGGPTVLTGLGLVLTTVFLWRRWWRGAILLSLAMAGAGVLDVTLKLAFRRARPGAFFDYPLPDSYSFPSGHALFAFCFFTTGAALLVPRLPHSAVRLLVGFVAAAAVLTIGFSRIYLGVHYPSDVVAGYTVGLIWSSVIIAGDRFAHAYARRRGGE